MDAVDDANSEGGDGFCCPNNVCVPEYVHPGQSFDDDDQDMFLPGCRGGLRNRQLLMNSSETDPTRRLVARHLGVFLDVFHPASVFAVTWDYIFLRG